MSVTNGIVSAPVTMNDIEDLLCDDEDYEMKHICTNDAINDWSLCKPTKWPLAAFDRDSIYDGRYWYQSIDSKCGWQWSYASTPAAAVSLSVPTPVSRSYIGTLIPTAVKTLYDSDCDYYPARLGDFIGYNHNAINCFGTSISHPTNVILGNKLIITSVMPTSLPTGNMTPADFGVDDYYFGVIIRLSSTYYVVTNDDTIGNSTGITINVTVPTTITEGNYYIYPIICSAYQNYFGSGTLNNASYMRIPGLSTSYWRIPLTTTETYYKTTVTMYNGTYNSSTGAYTFYVRAVNSGYSPSSVAVTTIYLRSSQSGSNLKSISGITLACATGGTSTSTVFTGTISSKPSQLYISAPYTVGAGTATTGVDSGTITGAFIVATTTSDD